MASSNEEKNIFLIKEISGLENEEKLYKFHVYSQQELRVETEELSQIIKKKLRLCNFKSIFDFFRQLLVTLLLPKGYPDSVCPEYVQFQFWDTCQEACGYFRGILANQAYLTTLGVGNPDVTVFSAIVMTMILDYASMVSGLIFAGSPTMVRKFAIHQRYWIMVHEGLNLVSTSFTLVSCLFPEYIIHILIVRNVLGALASVINGCCHSMLVTHIARKNNFSDCNAKEGNQSRTLKFLIIGIGYEFLIFVYNDGRSALVAFAILSFGKLLCQYKAMKTLKLRTLSPYRLQSCIKTWYNDDVSKMEISEVADREAVLYRQYGSINSVGSNIAKLKCSEAHFSSIVRIHSGVPHILVASDVSNNIDVLLKVEASETDIFKAYIHAFLYSIQRDATDNDNLGKHILQNTKETLELTLKNYTKIMETLKSLGWDIENSTLLPSSENRVEIDNSKKDL